MDATVNFNTTVDMHCMNECMLYNFEHDHQRDFATSQTLRESDFELFCGWEDHEQDELTLLDVSPITLLHAAIEEALGKKVTKGAYRDIDDSEFCESPNAETKSVSHDGTIPSVPGAADRRRFTNNETEFQQLTRKRERQYQISCRLSGQQLKHPSHAVQVSLAMFVMQTFISFFQHCTNSSSLSSLCFDSSITTAHALPS